jgi:osmotically-inducible protein OsmY
MTRLQTLAIAAALVAPASAFAQTYTERITVYEPSRYQAFVLKERGAIQSGGNNIADTLLADDVAMAIANDRRVNGASLTVSANNGRVSLSGAANQYQSEIARQVAQRVAGRASVSGELSNTGG